MTPLPTVFLALSLGGLAQAEANPDARLLLAVRQGDTAGAGDLLRRGASPGASDTEGTTALMWSAVYGDLDLLDALLAGGADVNAKNRAGATALMWALGDPRKVDRLVRAGADVNARADSGYTPLLMAANSDGASAVVKLLVERGADASVSGKSGYSALMAAAGGANGETFALLLPKGDAAGKTRVGWTVLHSAATGCKADRVRALLDRKAPVNAVETPQGRTPLMWAAANGAADAVKVLLERGADPNVQGTFGKDTALMRAAARGPGDAAIVKALLARGADPLARDGQGLTALDWALRQGDEEAAAAIRASYKEAVPAKEERAAPKTVGDSNTVTAALARSLPLLERASPAFAAASDERCISCHHQSLPAMAIGLARDRGLRTDVKLEREQAAETLKVLAPNRERYLQGIGVVDPLDPGYFLAGLAAAGQPADETIDALVHYLTLKQSPDGHWRPGLYRPPMVGSDFTTTALSLRALQKFALKGRAAEFKDRVGRARDWLRKASPQTTEDRAFQLLGLAWSKADAEAVRKATADLLALQCEDGGWAQLKTLGTDPYATGQVLYALHEGGGLAVTDPAYQKGVKYLLRTQSEDGSWYVPTRAMPVQPYFRSGFPHGRSQFISCAATCWATMALTLTITR
jgi:ankyrin repeat protein